MVVNHYLADFRIQSVNSNHALPVAYHPGNVIASERPQTGRHTLNEIGNPGMPGVLRCGIIRRGKVDCDAFGIFPTARLLGRSCSPNVHQQWVEKSGVMNFIAIRPIPQGQALSISPDVKGLLLPKGGRRTQLEQFGVYGCNCQSCQPTNLASDGRRDAIRIAILGGPLPNPYAQLVRIRDALNLMAAEDLHHFKDTLLFDGFSLCAQVEDLPNAQLWINRARAQAVITLSPGDPTLQELQALSINPRSWHRWATSPPTNMFPPPP